MQPDKDPPMDSDDDAIMDHVALECMHAIEAKDKDKFLDSLHVIVAHTIHGMSEPEDE